MSKQKNLQLIQLLRGVASVLVVLLHLTVNFSENLKQNFLANIFAFGGSGVDIFFVLSGFIITYAHLQHIGKATATGLFVKRRFIRIYPIYWIVITVFLAVQLLLPSFYKTHYSINAGNLISTYLLLPGHTMVNGVSWTLTNELFFYFLFIFALLIPKKTYSIYLAIGYFILLIALAFTGYSTSNSDSITGLVLFPMNIEFLLGIFIVLIVEKINRQAIIPMLLIGILWFIAGAVCVDKGIEVVTSTANSAMNRVIFFGLPAFLIILSLVKMELSKNVRVGKIFMQLGNASYSIYLIHLPLLAASFKIIAKLGITNYYFLILISILLFVIVCALGIFVYDKIEKPLIKKLNSIFLKPALKA
ncbi:MAG: acyltransferase [Ferruginibacter sp.]